MSEPIKTVWADGLAYRVRVLYILVPSHHIHDSSIICCHLTVLLTVMFIKVSTTKKDTLVEIIFLCSLNILAF